MLVLKNLPMPKVRTITVGERKLFKVRMYDVQESLGEKYI